MPGYRRYPRPDGVPGPSRMCSASHSCDRGRISTLKREGTYPESPLVRPPFSLVRVAFSGPNAPKSDISAGHDNDSLRTGCGPTGGLHVVSQVDRALGSLLATPFHSPSLGRCAAPVQLRG